jgi:hypothetical protein
MHILMHIIENTYRVENMVFFFLECLVMGCVLRWFMKISIIIDKANVWFKGWVGLNFTK